MSATIDVLNPDQPKRVLMLVSNAAVSPTTGWPIGFWWAELTHPYWEFVEKGYAVDIVSPDGGDLAWDSWSDPRDASQYSAHDLLSLGFISSPHHFALTQNTKPLAEVNLDEYKAIFLVGGQAPMVTFYNDERVHQFVAQAYEAGKVTAVVCHATNVLLKAKLANGELLVKGKTWTGFANAEEIFADNFVGQKNPAVLDRGRSQETDRQQFYCVGGIQGARRARRPLNYWPTAILGHGRRSARHRGSGRIADEVGSRKTTYFLLFILASFL